MPNSQTPKMSRAILFIFFGMLIYTGLLFVAEHFFPDEGQIFQIISTILITMSTLFASASKHALGLDQEDNPAPTPPKPAPTSISTSTTSTTVEKKEEKAGTDDASAGPKT